MKLLMIFVPAALGFGPVHSQVQPSGDAPVHVQVQPSGDSTPPSEVKLEMAEELELDSRLPDHVWNEVKKLQFTSPSGGYLSLFVQAVVRHSPQGDHHMPLHGSRIIVHTAVGRVEFDGPIVSFHSEMEGAFTDAGFTVMADRRRLQSAAKVIGLFNSIPEFEGWPTKYDTFPHIPTTYHAKVDYLHSCLHGGKDLCKYYGVPTSHVVQENGKSFARVSSELWSDDALQKVREVFSDLPSLAGWTYEKVGNHAGEQDVAQTWQETGERFFCRSETAGSGGPMIAGDSRLHASYLGEIDFMGEPAARFVVKHREESRHTMEFITSVPVDGPNGVEIIPKQVKANVTGDVEVGTGSADGLRQFTINFKTFEEKGAIPEATFSWGQDMPFSNTTVCASTIDHTPDPRKHVGDGPSKAVPLAAMIGGSAAMTPFWGAPDSTVFINVLKQNPDWTAAHYAEMLSKKQIMTEPIDIVRRARGSGRLTHRYEKAHKEEAEKLQKNKSPSAHHDAVANHPELQRRRLVEEKKHRKLEDVCVGSVCDSETVDSGDAYTYGHLYGTCPCYRCRDNVLCTTTAQCDGLDGNKNRCEYRKSVDDNMCQGSTVDDSVDGGLILHPKDDASKGCYTTSSDAIGFWNDYCDCDDTGPPIPSFNEVCPCYFCVAGNEGWYGQTDTVYGVERGDDSAAGSRCTGLGDSLCYSSAPYSEDFFRGNPSHCYPREELSCDEQTAYPYYVGRACFTTAPEDCDCTEHGGPDSMETEFEGTAGLAGYDPNLGDLTCAESAAETHGNCNDTCTGSLGSFLYPLDLPCDVTVSYPKACSWEIACDVPVGVQLGPVKVTPFGSFSLDCTPLYEWTPAKDFTCAYTGCVGLTFALGAPGISYEIDFASVTACIETRSLPDCAKNIPGGGFATQKIYSLTVSLDLAVINVDGQIMLYNTELSAPADNGGGCGCAQGVWGCDVPDATGTPQAIRLKAVITVNLVFFQITVFNGWVLGG
jgi:hypothetical protein